MFWDLLKKPGTNPTIILKIIKQHPNRNHPPEARSFEPLKPHPRFEPPLALLLCGLACKMTLALGERAKMAVAQRETLGGVLRFWTFCRFTTKMDSFWERFEGAKVFLSHCRWEEIARCLDTSTFSAKSLKSEKQSASQPPLPCKIGPSPAPNRSESNHRLIGFLNLARCVQPAPCIPLFVGPWMAQNQKHG